MSWKRIFNRKKWDEERALEIDAHLAIESDQNISKGMRVNEARWAANQKLGNALQIREEIFRMNSIGFLEILWQDLRFALRMLRKKPSFTIACVLTLALGIGATTAIFSAVDSMLLRPLPYKDPGRLIALSGTSKRQPDFSISHMDFLDLQKESNAFSQMAFLTRIGLNLSGVSQPEYINGCSVTPNFLSMLGVRPILGRDFLPEEEKQGAAPVLLLSYQLWQTHLGSDPNVAGRSIQLNGKSYTIVGVLPHSFFFFEKTDVLMPLGNWPYLEDLTERGRRGDSDVIGRLATGATTAQATAQAIGIAARLSKQFPATNQGYSVKLTTFRDQFVSDAGPALRVLFGAVMFVLLIACANVANLYLVRAAERAKEIAVRLAYGASRGRVVRQMLTESLLLATLGGVLGIILGTWAAAGLEQLMPMTSFQTLNFRTDTRVLLFAGALIVFVAVAFGLAPALKATQLDVQDTLKEGGRSSTPSASQHRLRGALAIAEIALALVLLAGAGLMMKSLYRLFQVSPGFQPESILTMQVDLESSRYSKGPAILNYWQQVTERVGAVPGVKAAAVATLVPFTGDHDRADITIDGQPLPSSGEFPHPDYHVVSPGYLNALALPLLRGRAFTESDDEKAPAVALINATLAHRYWPNGDPVGQRFTFGHPSANNHWLTIVGVVTDTKLYGLANPVRFEIYLPFRQHVEGLMTIVMRSTGDPSSLTSAVRAAIATVDKDQPVFAIQTMKGLIDNAVSTRHATFVLLGMFSGLALVLASIGIYGVMAYTVTLRTHEIGIRIAMGAQRRDVLQLVVGQGARLAFLGVGTGLIAALGLTRLLSTLLFGVSANDPITFAGVAGTLVLVALIACAIPAIRATRVDPLVGLRYE